MNIKIGKYFDDNNELSPWGDEHRDIASIEQLPSQQILPKAKKYLSIPTRKKPKSQRKYENEQNKIKIVDYELPMIKQKGKSMALNHQSMTIDQPAGRVIRNKSNRKVSQEHYRTIVTEKIIGKLKLNGKKYDPLPNENHKQTNRWLHDHTTRAPYSTSSSNSLLFTRSKDDVLKRVLFQLQRKIHQ